MTRKGAKQFDWTTAEIASLKKWAGVKSIREICYDLKRSRQSVKHMAHRLGISLRCYKPKLVWCSECATWRTYTDAKTGRCKVCSMRIRRDGREAACVEAWALLTIQQKEDYLNEESKRGTRRIPPRPKNRGGDPMSRYQRRLAEEAYLRDLEAWEYRKLQLQYDAAKTRLRRMREKSGTNPRK